jgi:2,3-dihydroxyphenylpropionate 1,2-dioxygenase
MEIVGAFGCSHAGLIVTRGDVAPPLEKAALYRAFRTMGERIESLAPDAIVMLGTDHGRIFSFGHLPQLTIGVSESAHSIGDAGLPVEDVPIHQPFARSILAEMIEDGVDLAFSEAMQIDHSFISPLTLALGTKRLPIVPIIVNCNVPPLPTLRRSYQIGQSLGRSIRKGPSGRVVVIGTGGLSHWVGSEDFQEFLRDPPGTRLARQKDHPLELTDTGYVNKAFDQDFIALLRDGKAQDFIGRYSTDRIFKEAGNGGQEIRNWLVVAGAVEDAPLDLIAYEAVAEWLTGTAVGAFRLEARAS